MSWETSLLLSIIYAREHELPDHRMFTLPRWEFQRIRNPEILWIALTELFCPANISLMLLRVLEPKQMIEAWASNSVSYSETTKQPNFWIWRNSDSASLMDQQVNELSAKCDDLHCSLIPTWKTRTNSLQFSSDCYTHHSMALTQALPPQIHYK